MSEHLINSLESIFRQVLDVLNAIFNKIISGLKTLERLPDLIISLGDIITKGFNDQIQSQSEMEIQIRMAKVSSKKGLVQAELEAILDLKEQLDQDLDEISIRYKKIQDELNSEAQKRVKELDDHLINLHERHFPGAMYTGYVEEISPLLETVYKDSMESYMERIAHLKKTVEIVRDRLQNFYEQRRLFFEKIDQFKYDESIHSTKDYFLPVLIVETENIKNSTFIKKAYLPGQLKNDASLSFTINEKLQQMDDLLNTETNLNKIIKRINWKHDEPTSEEINENMQKTLESNSFFGLSPVISEALKKSKKSSNIHIAKGFKNETN